MGVGGDFYNMITLSDSSFGIVMGDISGHGIAAAFLTAMLNMMIQNLTPQYYSPDQLLFHLNNQLYTLFEKSESMYFACVFYAVVNTKEGYIRYANAGQCLPLYVDAEQNIVAELDASGVPIGMIQNVQYRMGSFPYRPGDLILFYTDGLQDIYYREQPDEFTARMMEILSETRYVESLDEILDTVCDSFYLPEASEAKRMEMDDVSMILCRL
jgi:sigma-B regulation protein RsbU (phosphoserine phosphatase)